MRPTATAVAVCALCAALLWAMPVVAGEEPTPPVAFGVSPNPAQVGQTVGFRALAGGAGRYRWDLDGDGSFETDGGVSTTASHTYAQPGSVSVGLLVTDADGHEQRAVAEVVVSQAAGADLPGGPDAADEPAAGTEGEPGVADGAAAEPDLGAAAPAADGESSSPDDREPPADQGLEPPVGGPEGGEPEAEKPAGREPRSRPPRPATPRDTKEPRMPPFTPQAIDRMPRLRPVARIAATSVQIEDFEFSPSSINVEVGETVTWTNRGDQPHSATGQAFDTNILRSGETGSHRFTEAGTYSYICTPHPFMKGTVRVAAAGGGGGGGGSGDRGGSGGSGGGGGSRFSTGGTDLDISDPLIDETTGGSGGGNDDGGGGGSDLPTTGLDLLLLVALGGWLAGCGALLRRGLAPRRPSSI